MLAEDIKIAIIGLGYSGAIEEICVPVLERSSGFTFRTDFAVGYSPEHINVGDSC